MANVGRKAVPKAARDRLKALFAPHVDSFDQFVDQGLGLCVDALDAQEIEHPNGGPRLRFWLESVNVSKPVRSALGRLDSTPLFPSECRERALSYRGQLRAVLMRQVGDGEPEWLERRLGLMPVMLRSSRCNLCGFSPNKLVSHHEEASEMGGFFIINGNEKAIRLLIALSGASPFSLQTHPLSLRALGRPLAKLMSKPSIQQQLQLLRAIMPRVFESGKEQRLTPHV